VIYTSPEIAWVGKTEQQLKAEGREYKAASSRSWPTAVRWAWAHDGFVKMLADAKTDEILGVHIVAANASDLIAEAVVAMEFKAASEDIGRICHPHPSMSEVMREAALAVDKRS
jgi:dihydrolipoamide dehydrogenase